MTERHIPVGAYPYLRDERTTLGTVVAVDHGKKIITVESPEGDRNFRVTDRTRIWLDRSQQQKTTLDGDFEDIQTGLKTEVRSVGDGATDTADWVKLQR